MALIVDREDLLRLFAKKGKEKAANGLVTELIKKGMPHEKVKQGKRDVYRFDLMEVIKWHAQNIATSQFREICYGEDISLNDELVKKRIEKIELENAITRGEYIPIDEVDETTETMAALLISQYRNLLRTLPNLIARKSETQIKKALDLAFKENIDQLRQTLIEKSEDI